MIRLALCLMDTGFQFVSTFATCHVLSRNSAIHRVLLQQGIAVRNSVLQACMSGAFVRYRPFLFACLFRKGALVDPGRRARPDIRGGVVRMDKAC